MFQISPQVFLNDYHSFKKTWTKLLVQLEDHKKNIK